MRLNSDNGLIFIAEIGQNHQGSVVLAKEIARLVAPWADVIKTARRQPEAFPDKWREQPYTSSQSFGKTYYEHRLALELRANEFVALLKYVENELETQFCASYTDKPSLDFIVDAGVTLLKIPSSRAVDLPLLEDTAVKELPTILSTGMCGLGDIMRAQSILRGQLFATLQCASVYPATLQQVGYQLIERFRSFFTGRIGLSSHSYNWRADLLALAHGATVFERHVTLHKLLKGSDHSFSLLPEEFGEWVRTMRAAHVALQQDKTKRVLRDEQPAIDKLRWDL